VNYVLVVHDPEWVQGDPPALYGPFTNVTDASIFAERLRKHHGLPIEATSKNNERWTDEGWYFGIVELRTSVPA
jgi:hypothetical protein